MKWTVDVRYLAGLLAVGALVYFSGILNLNGKQVGKTAVNNKPSLFDSLHFRTTFLFSEDSVSCGKHFLSL
jgi:hypothetical protein